MLINVVLVKYKYAVGKRLPYFVSVKHEVIGAFTLNTSKLVAKTGFFKGGVQK